MATTMHLSTLHREEGESPCGKQAYLLDKAPGSRTLAGGAPLHRTVRRVPSRSWPPRWREAMGTTAQQSTPMAFHSSSAVDAAATALRLASVSSSTAKAQSRAGHNPHSRL
jgi:hypothetical protein